MHREKKQRTNKSNALSLARTRLFAPKRQTATVRNRHERTLKKAQRREWLDWSHIEDMVEIENKMKINN